MHFYLYGLLKCYSTKYLSRPFESFTFLDFQFEEYFFFFSVHVFGDVFVYQFHVSASAVCFYLFKVETEQNVLTSICTQDMTN